MNEDLNSVDHVVKTGNVMADAIVNSKVVLAKRKEIRLDVTAKVPERLPRSLRLRRSGLSEFILDNLRSSFICLLPMQRIRRGGRGDTIL